MSHLTIDLYLLALRGEIPLGALVRRAHAHLLEICQICAREWDGGEDGQGLPLPEPGEVAPVLDDVPEDWVLTQERIDRQQQRLADRREAARLARQDLKRLLRLPAHQWADRVKRARTRFKSRAFAELLVEESRRRVRSRPEEAAVLASLVPAVLSRRGPRPDQGWGPPLLARAAAHRANALRVAGDLPAAAEAFARLRRQLERHAVDDPALAAEVDSLEASLAIDARHLSRAQRLLVRAIAVRRQLGDREGEARVRIQLANLVWTLDRPEEALEQFERAAPLVELERAPGLAFCIVTGRVNALCDLGEAAAAGDLLAREGHVYAAMGEPQAHALHGALLGRVALGLGRPGEAEERFAAARDHLLELGRDYDAILCSLDLAAALLEAGKMAELKQLAADLVPLFRSRGVARETLAALRLLAQAALAEEVDAALLARVRRQLEDPGVTSAAG